MANVLSRSFNRNVWMFSDVALQVGPVMTVLILILNSIKERCLNHHIKSSLMLFSLFIDFIAFSVYIVLP
jgi:hypothetical protein